jgi:hypothetical protein
MSAFLRQISEGFLSQEVFDDFNAEVNNEIEKGDTETAAGGSSSANGVGAGTGRKNRKRHPWSQVLPY